MTLLALGAAFAGLAGSPWLHAPLLHLLGETHVHEGIDLPILLWSTAALAIGFSLAFVVGFQRRQLLPAGVRPLGRRLYGWAVNKYYADEAYARWIIQPFLRLTERLAGWDQRIIDGAVNAAGRLGAQLGEWKGRFDRVVVDGVVNGVAFVVRGAGTLIRPLQTGVIQQYLFVVVAAVVILSAIIRR